MEYEALIRSIIQKIDIILPSGDLSLFHEFLAKGEPQLAIEYLCDRLFEHEIVISQELGKMLIVLAGKMGMSAYRTWRGIWVESSVPGERQFLNLEFPDLQKPVLEIFEKIRDRMPSDAVTLIHEFLDHWEVTLAIDELCQVLVQHNISISQQDKETLQSIWLDLGHNPAELADLSIQQENKK
jgi:hypothetical protein